MNKYYLCFNCDAMLCKIRNYSTCSRCTSKGVAGDRKLLNKYVSDRDLEKEVILCHMCIEYESRCYFKDDEGTKCKVINCTEYGDDRELYCRNHVELRRGPILTEKKSSIVVNDKIQKVEILDPEQKEMLDKIRDYNPPCYRDYMALKSTKEYSKTMECCSASIQEFSEKLELITEYGDKFKNKLGERDLAVLGDNRVSYINMISRLKRDLQILADNLEVTASTST